MDMHTSTSHTADPAPARTCPVCDIHGVDTRWPWCSRCNTAVLGGWRWALVAGAAYGLAVSQLHGALAGSWAAVFGTLLALLAGIDARTNLLPDRLTLPMLTIGLACNLFGMFTPFPEAALGAVTGYGLYWALGWASALVSGRVALGLGDAVMLAAIGAWLGYHDLLLVQGIAAGAGLLYVSWRWLRGQGDLHTALPFGPWLALGGAVTMLLR